MEIKYKKQGDGSDSWEISEYEMLDGKRELSTRYMVYEDPNVKPIPDVDIVALLNSCSPEILNKIKQILK